MTENENEKDEALTGQSRNVGDQENPEASSLISVKTAEPDHQFL